MNKRFNVRVPGLDDFWLRRVPGTCKHEPDSYFLLAPSGMFVLVGDCLREADVVEPGTWRMNTELAAGVAAGKRLLDGEEVVSKTAEKNARKYAAVAAYKAKMAGEVVKDG